MSVPALKTNELMDTVLTIDAKQFREGDFIVRKLRKEIDQVRQHEAATAYMLDGILSARLREYDSSKRAHEASIRLVSNDKTLLWNFSTSMTSFARYPEALTIVKRLVDCGFTDDEYLKSLLWLSLVSVDVSALKDAWSMINTHGEHLLRSTDINEIKSSSEVLDGFLLENPDIESDMGKIFNHVQCVLESCNQVVIGLDIVEDAFYDQRVMHLNYLVETEDLNVVNELNNAVVEKISVDNNINYWDSVIPSFIMHEKIEDEGAVEYVHHG